MSILTVSIQSALLSAASNLLAQSLQAYRAAKPLTYNLTTILHFALFALISTPPNVLWQEWLESNYPTTVRDSKSPTKTRPSKSNTIKKFLLDQCLGLPVNTALFLAVMAGFRGLSGWEVVEHVESEFIPLSIASYKFWPLVSIVSFQFLPVEQRVLFGGIVALGWNVYLSLMMAQ